MVADVVPSLVIFTLDILLTFRVEDELMTSVKKLKNRYYPEVPQVLNRIHDSYEAKIAVIHDNDIAEKVAEIFTFYQWDELFPFQEVNNESGKLNNRLKSLQNVSGLNFYEMMFFDPDRENVRTAQKLGLYAEHVPRQRGMRMKFLLEAMREYGPFVQRRKKQH